MKITKERLLFIAKEILDHYNCSFGTSVCLEDIRDDLEIFCNTIFLTGDGRFRSEEEVEEYAIMIIKDIVVKNICVKTRSQNAVEFFLENYFNHLYNIARIYSSIEGLHPDDLIHEFFLRVISPSGYLEKYDPSRGSLKNYLFKQFLYYERKRNKKSGVIKWELSEDGVETKYVIEPELITSREHMIERERLKNAYEKLPTLDKLILLSFFPEELREITGVEEEYAKVLRGKFGDGAYRRKKQEAMDRFLFAYLHEKYGKNKSVKFYEDFIRGLDEMESYIFIRILPLEIQMELKKRGFKFKPSFYSAEAIRRNLQRKFNIQVDISTVREYAKRLWRKFANSFCEKRYKLI